MGLDTPQNTEYYACTHPLIGLLVLVASDGHHVRPISRLHEHPGNMRTGDMEGGGAALIGALYTRATDLLGALVAVHTLLKYQRENKSY